MVDVAESAMEGLSWGGAPAIVVADGPVRQGWGGADTAVRPYLRARRGIDQWLT